MYTKLQRRQLHPSTHMLQAPQTATTQPHHPSPGLQNEPKDAASSQKSQRTSFKKHEAMSASLILRFHPIAIADESGHDKRSKTREACERNRSYDLCLRDTRTAAPSKREGSALRVDLGQLHRIKHKQEGTHSTLQPPSPTHPSTPPPPSC